MSEKVSNTIKVEAKFITTLNVFFSTTKALYS